MNCQRLILSGFLLVCFKANTQQLRDEEFSRYTTLNGLSDNNITGVVEDPTGYLWISSMWGLNRLNGQRAVQFHPRTDSLSLPAEEVRTLQWLDKHRLAAIGTGIHIIDTRTMQTRNVFIPYHNKKYQFKFNMVAKVKSDHEGNLYVLTRSGFYHYDNNYTLLTRFDYYSEKEVPVNHFHFGTELFELDSQRLLIISNGGLYVYDKLKKAVQKMSAGHAPILSEFLNYPHDAIQFFEIKPGEFFVMKSKTDSLTYVNLQTNRKVVSILPFRPIGSAIGWRSRLLQISTEVFYISGHHSGIYKLRLSSQSGKVECSTQKELDAYLCTALSKDREGRLLIATTKGLLRQKSMGPAVQTVELPASLEEKYPAIHITDVYTSADKVYAGSRGGGVLVFDKNSLQFERNLLFTNAEKGNNIISGFTPMNTNTLVLGTQGLLGLLQLDNNALRTIRPPGWSRANDWTNDVSRDSRNGIWISSSKIYRYNLSTGEFTTIPLLPELLEVPVVIEEDRQGNIWMACHGLARYNTKLNKYDLFIDSFPYIKMPDKQVDALAIDSQNTIWFNSNNNGLIAYNPHTKSFRHFTRSNSGLPDNNVSALKVVGNKVWIACYNGIACIDIKTSKIETFRREDGFPNAPVLKGSRFFYDQDERQLYIGFANTLARFDPEAIQKKLSPPQTFVETVVVNGKTRISHPLQNITTSWKENEFNITIGTINFREGSMQHFAYRVLENDSTPWFQTGPQGTFSISGLSPGDHRIQVKTFSTDNRWPEQIREITISIRPPFWRTTWFVLATGVLFLSLLYLFIKWRVHLARKKEMVETQIQRLKADDYKAQFELEQISNYFSSSLAGKKTEADVLWDVAHNLIGQMNYEDCIIYGWNESRTKMIQKAAYGPKGIPEVITASSFEVAPGQGIVGHVINTRQPVLVRDTRQDLRYRIDDDVRLSEISVPIIHDDELLGVIDSEHHQVGYFTERDTKILTTIATLIGNKLKQLESEQTLEAKQKELAGINEQLAEAKLSALQAQMNPHFVFNALNSIKRMILDGESDHASRYLSKFALMIRMTLEHSKETFVTLHENIQYIKAYLEMESLRFGDSFTYELRVGETIDTSDATIPSMMIQPIVENAIWHGLLHSGRDKRLQISFEEQEGRLICVVEDNGIGILRSQHLKKSSPQATRSVGLDNLRRRIRIMNDKYKTGCTLELVDLSEIDKSKQGTKVVLTLNLVTV